MINFEEAVENVRKAFPEQYVLKGFEFRDKYTFELLSKHYKELYTDQGGYVQVKKNSGDVVTFNFDEAFDNMEEFAKARDNARIIDKVNR